MRSYVYVGLLTLLIYLIVPCASYNILVIFAHPGKSHYDVFKPLFQELGERGHNLTILSHVETKGEIKNSRDVLISNTSARHILEVSMFPGNRLQKYMETYLIAKMANMFCEPSLASEPFQQYLKEDNKYDVILAEFFNSNCFYGLITKLQAPFIGLSSCGMMAWHPQWFGTPANPSYIPSLYMAHPVPMTFFQRVENTLVHLGHKAWYAIFMEYPGTHLSRKYIGYDPVDPYNASLYLLNIHHSLHGARPLTPSVVEVGGIHVSKKTAKKLSQDIEEWSKGSKKGLIYFCFGSMLKGHTIPSKELGIINRVFSELTDYRVLWKWENDTMVGKADNVMIKKWTPQFDILCHPSTALFISHGGLLGTTEAVHCGVPTMIMPQFGDQPFNAEALRSQGAGVVVKLREITYESFKEAIQKALSPETKKNAQELSRRFNDRLVSPLDTAVYWVEHVARNKGARHMRSAAIDMPFYQYLLLDVFAFLLSSIVLFIFIVYVSLRFICRSRRQKLKTT